MNSFSDREFENESVRVFDGVRIFKSECVLCYPYHVNSFHDREFESVRVFEGVRVFESMRVFKSVSEC